MKTKKTVLALLFVLLLLLSSCSHSDKKYPNYNSIAVQTSEDVIACFKNKDIEGLKSLFCPEIQNTHDLDKEISEALEFMDGDIVKYDTPYGATGGGTLEYGERVELSLEGNIINIVTTSGKTYSILIDSFAIYKEKPDYLGITFINIFSEDQVGDDGIFPESAKFMIGEVLP